MSGVRVCVWCVCVRFVCVCVSDRIGVCLLGCLCANFACVRVRCMYVSDVCVCVCVCVCV